MAWSHPHRRAWCKLEVFAFHAQPVHAIFAQCLIIWSWVSQSEIQLSNDSYVNILHTLDVSTEAESYPNSINLCAFSGDRVPAGCWSTHPGVQRIWVCDHGKSWWCWPHSEISQSHNSWGSCHHCGEGKFKFEQKCWGTELQSLRKVY